jgi:two-component system response regulator VicR
MTHRQRVVVVNDEPAILELYRDMLAELDYETVGLETTGVETDRIRAFEPDAVVLDLEVGLQASYGIDMARQLREEQRYRNIPIVVATARADALDGARRHLRDLGVPVLLKPFTIEQISEALRPRR